LLKEENGGLLVGCYSILNKLKNCCSTLLNIHDSSEFRECELRPQETEKGTKHRRNKVQVLVC
jgi:hypothetical protein